MAHLAWIKTGVAQAVTAQIWHDVATGHGTRPPYLQLYAIKPEDEALGIDMLRRLYPLTVGADAKITVEKRAAPKEA